MEFCVLMPWLQYKVFSSKLKFKIFNFFNLKIEETKINTNERNS